MKTVGRPKKHTTPYTGDTKQLESSFRDYLSCIADCFGTPYDDRDYDAADSSGQRKSTSLRAVCDEFSISIPKARKLLITAGVYSTTQSRRVEEFSAQGKSVEEIAMLTGLSRSSVSSYLPYQTFSYNMDECSRHAEDSRKYRERKKTVEKLQEKIKDEKKIADGEAGELYNAEIDTAELDKALWQCMIAFQNYPFYTTSGLSFSYTVRRKKNGEYSGELEISRKEESKTLTRSSVLLAFHKVLEGIRVAEGMYLDDTSFTALIPAEYKGPKSIGQIFGISYVYSLFWRWGLIQVPEKVENKLRGKGK